MFETQFQSLLKTLPDFESSRRAVLLWSRMGSKIFPITLRILGNSSVMIAAVQSLQFDSFDCNFNIV